MTRQDMWMREPATDCDDEPVMRLARNALDEMSQDFALTDDEEVALSTWDDEVWPRRRPSRDADNK